MEKEEKWKKFLRKYWQMAIVFIAIIAAAALIGLSVFLWVLGDAQTTGLVPALLGEWSVGYLVTFILTVAFWEIVYVVSWMIPIMAILYLMWYKKIPEEDQKEFFGDESKGKSAEDGFSFFVGLVWLGIVWITGRWNLAFQSWTINDWIYTWLMACIPLLVIAGIFGTLYVAYSLSKDKK